MVWIIIIAFIVTIALAFISASKTNKKKTSESSYSHQDRTINEKQTTRIKVSKCPECGGLINDYMTFCDDCGMFIQTIDEAVSKFDKEVGFTDIDEDLLNDNKSYLCCPKCYSNNLTPMNRGFSFGNAAIGAVTLGLYGILAGSIGSQKVNLFCGGCGKTFKSSDAISLTRYEQKYFKKNRL